MNSRRRAPCRRHRVILARAAMGVVVRLGARGRRRGEAENTRCRRHGRVSAPRGGVWRAWRSSRKPVRDPVSDEPMKFERNASFYHVAGLRVNAKRARRGPTCFRSGRSPIKMGPHHCGPCTRSPSSLTGQPSTSHRTWSRLTVAIGSLTRDLELGVRPCSDGGRPLRILRPGGDQPHIGQEQVPPRQPRTRPGGTYSLGTNCCLVFSRRSASLLSTLNSTLRFLAIPSDVVLVAMGCRSPYPTTVNCSASSSGNLFVR
jgi:hypothetical protein